MGRPAVAALAATVAACASAVSHPRAAPLKGAQRPPLAALPTAAPNLGEPLLQSSTASPQAQPGIASRRKAILQLTSATCLACGGAFAPQAHAVSPGAIETANWLPLDDFNIPGTAHGSRFPEPFVMYLSRLLIRYDPAVGGWYRQQLDNLPPHWEDERAQHEMQHRLGKLGASVAHGLSTFEPTSASAAALWGELGSRYGGLPGSEMQLALLFTLLPPGVQPTDMISASLRRQQSSTGDCSGLCEVSPTSFAEPVAAASAAVDTDIMVVDELRKDADALLPPQIVPRWDTSVGAFVLSSRYLQPGTFGSMASSPIAKEVDLSLATYGLFALAGGLGCSLTHVLVTPIDMVKTRLQTRPGRYKDFVDAVQTIRKEEGTAMLLQGADVTSAGFFMYGVVVYPGYEVLKRWLFALVGEQAVLQFRVPLVLLAGALATVVVSFVLTPFEAVRIRMVERPEYAPNAAAALGRYLDEGGVPSLYSGLVPLMVRQVSFGMVKFLVFDYAKDLILALLDPVTREQVAVQLLVSLLSGAIAGIFASVVSQPADVILSKVAERASSTSNQIEALVQTSKSLWNELGPGGFFLGLGSRCVFAAAIIAGQFFLYDAFKEGFSISGDDLTVFLDVLGMVMSHGSVTN